MKKSNLILWGAFVAALFFTLIFQLDVHKHVKMGKMNLKSVQMLEENREVASFSSILAHGSVKILFTQGGSQSLQVSAPDYFLDSVNTLVNHKTLDIKIGSALKKKDSVIISITNTELDSVLLHATARIESIGEISGDTLFLNFRDKSSAKLDLSYDTITYENNSSGQISLTGAVSKIKLTDNKEE